MANVTNGLINYCIFFSRFILFYDVFCIPVIGHNKKCMVLEQLIIVGLFYYDGNYVNLANFQAALLWRNIYTANVL